MKELKYNIINTDQELDTLIDNLNNQHQFVFDLESSGFETHSADIKIVGIGFCWEVGVAFYIPFNKALDQEKILEKLTLPFLNDSIGKIGHNIKFDVRLLDRFGIKVNNILFDTCVASYSLYGDRLNHNLDDLSLHHLNHIKIRTKSLIPKKSSTNPNPSMLDSPADEVGLYCCEDVDYTFRLFELFHTLLSLPENVHCKKLFYEIDMPLVPILIKMECQGVKIDEKRLETLRVELSTQMQTMHQEINTMAGRPVVLTNPSDVGNLVFIEKGLGGRDTEIVRTRTGRIATTAATLEALAGEPLVDKILEYKTLNKLMSTYILAMPSYISKHTGLLHPFFNQTGTSTGRLSSSSPNCFDKETEILTTGGWKLFKDITLESLVAQYNLDNTIDFVNPSNIIEQKAEFIYDIKSEQEHINISVTEDHRLLLLTREDKVEIVNPNSYKKDRKQLSAGILNKNLTYGINYDLIFAIQADGSLTDTGVDFSFRRQRKIDRFEKNIAPLKKYKDRSRTVLKYEYIPNYVWEYIDINTKKFTSKIIELACPQVLDYLMAWDGDFTRGQCWLSKEKTNCDFIQALLTCSGYRTMLGTYTINNRLYHLVRVCNKNYTWTTNCIIKQRLYNDSVFCVSVPSTYIVTRRGKSVSITGNCQNIPAKNKIGKQIREAFISRFPGGYVLSVDYNQAELRILAHMSKEPVFLNAYRNNEDIHTAVAAEVIFNKPKDQVTKEERTPVKVINFGLMYGMRGKKLAATLGISIPDANALLAKYMTKMGNLRKFLDGVRLNAAKVGYSEGFFGRRRYVPKIFSDNQLMRWSAEREAANNVIQNTNADIIRIAMVRVQDMIDQNKFKSIMILQVHDELVFDIHPEELEVIVPKIVNIMQTIVKFDILMKAEAKHAANWSDAH